MTRPILRRLATVAVAAIVAVAPATLSTTATAAPAEPPSTPIPFPAADGELMSYVVNAKKANPDQTRQVAKAVKAAGGVVVQQWPQVGVVVAQSERAAFRSDIVKYGYRSVDSVGATRTVAVTEGTPDGVSTPWKKSAAPQRKANSATKADLTYGDASFDAPAPDPREGEQWDLVQIKADQAHQLTDGSRRVLVGVLDSGIDPEHPDLRANIDAARSVNCTDAGRPDRSAGGWYPTTSYHGTHVAGTIAAARNGVGIVGVAPNVRMASVKVVNDDGFIYPEYAVCGFMWAGLKGMDVTNNSYFIDPVEFWCDDQPDQAAVRTAVERAVNWATTKGVVHAAAAGNAAYDLSHKTTDTDSPNDSTAIERFLNQGCKDIPTELKGVVTVSSTDQAGKLSSFSNRGLGSIDVAAPGSRILSTLPNNTYGLLSGTSMASPHVAGVLALMKSKHPSWTPAQMIKQLRKEAEDHICMPPSSASGAVCVGKLANNSYYGQGIVDALDAVR